MPDTLLVIVLFKKLSVALLVGFCPLEQIGEIAILFVNGIDDELL